MHAMRMRQKDAVFYFVSYPVEDLLAKVQFVSRFYGEAGEAIGGERDRRKKPDEIERFVAAIEGSDRAFQRSLNRRKIRQIGDFFRAVSGQPMVPGAILLYTSEQLAFRRTGSDEKVGHLSEPRGKFLIIDGQHRLAGLHFYRQESEDDRELEIPCVIFDGRTSDFATEMFVVINSTHTRINKSHLVDLYGRIEWGTDPGKKYAASLVRALYETSDSPLRYHINMLGGRSQQQLWINQAQLFGEIHRLIRRRGIDEFFQDGRGWNRMRGYCLLRDVFRATRASFRDAWGDNRRYMLTRDVSLKALVRVAGDVAAAFGDEFELGQDSSAALTRRFEPWSELSREFRREGFYERFAAKGQVERVEKIRRRLTRSIGV